MSAIIFAILVLSPAAITGLIVHAAHERSKRLALEDDLSALWAEVFGFEDDEPDPADEKDDGEKVVALRVVGRSA